MTQPHRQTHSIFAKQFSFSTNFAISFILYKENALVRKLRIMQTGIWYIPINVCNLSLYQILSDMYVIFRLTLQGVSYYQATQISRYVTLLTKKCTKLPSQKFHCTPKLYIPSTEETCTFLFLIFSKLSYFRNIFIGKTNTKLGSTKS